MEQSIPPHRDKVFVPEPMCQPFDDGPQSDSWFLPDIGLSNDRYDFTEKSTEGTVLKG